jgi:hypothetical protein
MELCSTGGFPLEKESKFGFISIMVSLLVLLLSIFCCSIGICRKIYVYALYNTFGTLHYKLFFKHKLFIAKKIVN